MAVLPVSVAPIVTLLPAVVPVSTTVLYVRPAYVGWYAMVWPLSADSVPDVASAKMSAYTNELLPSGVKVWLSDVLLLVLELPVAPGCTAPAPVSTSKYITLPTAVTPLCVAFTVNAIGYLLLIYVPVIIIELTLVPHLAVQAVFTAACGIGVLNTTPRVSPAGTYKLSRIVPAVESRKSTCVPVAEVLITTRLKRSRKVDATAVINVVSVVVAVRVSWVMGLTRSRIPFGSTTSRPNLSDIAPVKLPAEEAVGKEVWAAAP